MVSDQHAGRLARRNRVRGLLPAVVPLVSLTDRQPARLIYLASSALSALSCFGIALCDSLLPALGFRAAAGIALAGMYMPGLQALTEGIEGTMRARIAAWYTSSFTIGASLSFLLGRIGTTSESAANLTFSIRGAPAPPRHAWRQRASVDRVAGAASEAKSTALRLG